MIDLTYFYAKPTYIPFANNSGAGISQTFDVDKKAELNAALAIREKEYLIKLLGETLYNDFIAGLAEDPIDPKWTALESAIYDSTLKTSPVADYFYFYYLDLQFLTDIGVVIPKVENGTLVSSKPLQVRTWNRMVDRNFTFLEWLTSEDVSPDYIDYELPYWIDGYTKINIFDI